MPECYNFSCQGESHKGRGIPCQDSSSSTILEDGSTIIIVSDGHGGDSYFRSDVGARIAVEVTNAALLSFLKNIDGSLFIHKPFTMNEAISAVKTDSTPINNCFCQLFSEIVDQWRQTVVRHFENTLVNEQELKIVNEHGLTNLKDKHRIWSIYGCTLLAYVQTPSYWFAFQLGDGTCVSFHQLQLWKEPVPWDDRCFLNETTSLCDIDASIEFRYCYEGDGEFPMAVFIGSDGMDDSFEDIPALVSFYIGIIKMLVFEGRDATIYSIEEDLPKLSSIGSYDDMSLAFVYDIEALKNSISRLLQFQIDLVKRIILQQTVEIGLGNKKSSIEYYYRLLNRYDNLMRQWTSAIVSEYKRQKEEDGIA